MKVSINVDPKPILHTLREMGQDRQGPFILARGLNLLAKKVQKNLRADFEGSLTLRRKGWILQQVKINTGQWATKTRLRVVIELTQSANFISRMETGEEKHPVSGHKYLVFPNAKSFGKRIITKDNVLKYKNLGLTQTPFGIRGRQRTFMVKTEAGTPLVLQRVAKDAHKSYKKGREKSTGLRMLYTLIKSAKIPKKIHWYTTANQTVIGTFTQVIKEALASVKKV